MDRVISEIRDRENEKIKLKSEQNRGRYVGTEHEHGGENNFVKVENNKMKYAAEVREDEMR